LRGERDQEKKEENMRRSERERERESSERAREREREFKPADSFTKSEEESRGEGVRPREITDVEEATG